MFLGMPFGTWLPWIIAFAGLLIDWYIGIVVWGKEKDDAEKKD